MRRAILMSGLLLAGFLAFFTATAIGLQPYYGEYCINSMGSCGGNAGYAPAGSGTACTSDTHIVNSNCQYSTGNPPPNNLASMSCTVCTGDASGTICANWTGIAGGQYPPCQVVEDGGTTCGQLQNGKCVPVPVQGGGIYCSCQGDGTDQGYCTFTNCTNPIN